MRRLAMVLASLILAGGPAPGAASGAQAADGPDWKPFPVAESHLVLAVPGLPRLPTQAAELEGGEDGIRNFHYGWGQPLAAAAFADVIVSQVARAGRYFATAPDYARKLTEAFAYLAAGRPAFAATETIVSAPIGSLSYRAMMLADRHCIGFGGVFGVLPGNVAFAAGAAPQGDKWIYGLYCPAAGQALTPEGARYILEGFGWEGIGTARRDRPRPARLMAPG